MFGRNEYRRLIEWTLFYSFFLHTGDPDKSVRVQGVHMVLQITDKDEEFRKLGQPPPTYQQFIVPKIDINAKHYSRMIKINHDGVGHYYYYPATFYGKEVRDKKSSSHCPSPSEEILEVWDCRLHQEALYYRLFVPLTTLWEGSKDYIWSHVWLWKNVLHASIRI